MRQCHLLSSRIVLLFVIVRIHNHIEDQVGKFAHADLLYVHFETKKIESVYH